jgi:NAD+ kinase
MSTPNIHFVASQMQTAGEAVEKMMKRYGQSDLDDADVVVALGGDGFMLRTLHRMIARNLPVFGMTDGGGNRVRRANQCPGHQ